MKNKKQKLNFFCYLLLIAGTFSVPGNFIMADTGVDSLVISEIMYDPAGSDSGHSDWIEIYNPDPQKSSIDRETFGIIDEDKIEIGADGTHYKNCHKIDRDIEIDAKEYAVITQDKDDFLVDYPAVKKDVVLDSAFSLSSAGDRLRLSNDRCATFFRDISYENSWGGKNNGRTLEKIKMDQKYAEADWQESYVLSGTPGEKNSEKPAEPPPREYGRGIILNEILPHPEKGEEEYIELYNSAEKEADISQYVLKDG